MGWEKASWKATVIGVPLATLLTLWQIWASYHPSEQDQKTEQSSQASNASSPKVDNIGNSNNIVVGNGSQQVIAQNGMAISNDSGTVIISNGVPLEVPTIKGYYTLCPSHPVRGLTGKWHDFLYDISTNRNKLVFLDVSVYLYCEGGGIETEKFVRSTTDHSVSYVFGRAAPFDSALKKANASTSGPHKSLVTGNRDQSQLMNMIPDNGTDITVFDDRSGTNSYTRLRINNEGLEDTIWGPYLIKVRGEDGTLSFELTAPVLDSVSQAKVAAIADDIKRNRGR